MFEKVIFAHIKISLNAAVICLLHRKLENFAGFWLDKNKYIELYWRSTGKRMEVGRFLKRDH